MEKTDLLASLFDNKDLVLKKADVREDTVALFLELRQKEQPCPNCGCLTRYVHDYRTQKLKEMPMLGKETILIFR